MVGWRREVENKEEEEALRTSQNLSLSQLYFTSPPPPPHASSLPQTGSSPSLMPGCPVREARADCSSSSSVAGATKAHDELLYPPLPPPVLCESFSQVAEEAQQRGTNAEAARRSVRPSVGRWQPVALRPSLRLYAVSLYSELGEEAKYEEYCVPSFLRAVRRTIVEGGGRREGSSGAYVNVIRVCVSVTRARPTDSSFLRYSEEEEEDRHSERYCATTVRSPTLLSVHIPKTRLATRGRS